jgi:methionine-rich copper-binding protein CopC
LLKITPSGPPDLLETSTELTTLGAYVVRWQVLAIDGHITRGDVPFTVTGH